MNPKLVIFDLDGTLLNTIADLREAVNYALTIRDLPQHSLEVITHMVGHGARNLITQALPAELSNDETLIDAVLADFRLYYNAHIDVYTKPFPGIPELIAKLHQEGVMLAVASNKFQEGTEHLIKEFFPDIPFVAVLGNRQGFPLKPDPEVVGEVLRKAGVNREDAVVVGDSDTDMETAINGGIRGIAVGWGYRDMKHTPGLTVAETVEELQNMLL